MGVLSFSHNASVFLLRYLNKCDTAMSYAGCDLRFYSPNFEEQMTFNYVLIHKTVEMKRGVLSFYQDCVLKQMQPGLLWL